MSLANAFTQALVLAANMRIPRGTSAEVLQDT